MPAGKGASAVSPRSEEPRHTLETDGKAASSHGLAEDTFALDGAAIGLAHGLDEALLIAVEPNGGEEAGAESSCISRDAVGREHRAIADDRMAVDDTPGQPARIVEKLAPDPQEIILILIPERNIWPDNGMHEEIPAIVMRQREVADEIYMAAEPVGYRQFIPHAGIAFQHMVEEEPRPVGNHSSSSDAAHKEVIVIAAETDKFIPVALRARDQPLDDSIRIAIPIHVVTHEDDLGACLADGGIRRDQVE